MTDQVLSSAPRVEIPASLNPMVFSAARAVGIMKPRFRPGQNGSVFADELKILGTAFWLKDYKVLITCAHVINDLVGAPVEVTGLLVVGNNGNYSRAVIDVIDLRRDLAVLRLEAASEIVENESQSGLELDVLDPKVGTRVAYAGYPLGEKLITDKHAPTYAEGLVGSTERMGKDKKREIQITGPVVGGFSGSPIVAVEDGRKVLGIVSRGPSETKDIFFAVSAKHIKALADLAIS